MSLAFSRVILINPSPNGLCVGVCVWVCGIFVVVVLCWLWLSCCLFWLCCCLLFIRLVYMSPGQWHLLAALLVYGTSNELLACIEFCFWNFCVCAGAEEPKSRQSLACIEFHWFMFHMKTQERASAAPTALSFPSISPPKGWNWIWVGDWETEARLRLVTMQWLHLLSILPTHFRFVVFIIIIAIRHEKKGMPLQQKYFCAREMINFWLKARHMDGWLHDCLLPEFGMPLIGNSKRTYNTLETQAKGVLIVYYYDCQTPRYPLCIEELKLLTEL